MKAYVVLAQSLQSSMSKVLYVELLNVFSSFFGVPKNEAKKDFSPG